MKLALLAVWLSLPLLAADAPKPLPKLPADKALRIAKLEATRNAKAAEFQGLVVQAERAQRAVQEADAAYRAAIEEERKAAGVPANCQLKDSDTWECPAPEPSTTKDSKKEASSNGNKESSNK